MLTMFDRPIDVVDRAECTAVAVGSPDGDGVFPVFAEFKDGRLVGISVRFE